ncbi:MAG TPA: transglutaminase domain-containing protein [Candidatus Sulfotelmatobacter sp.]|nr:transglutaminase domain-containing protein [Candidatus Sulfotelmatobacter sp.]
MKTPPFLIGATLVFWGWQTGFLPIGIIMAVILESSRFIETRWEYTDDEFARIWTFCNLLLLAALIFAFNDNGGPSDFSQLFENLNSNSEKVAGTASNMTADAVIRWLPMIFFLFVVAQTFSPADGIPLEAVFFLLRSRLKRARKRGQPTPPSRRFNALYPYFALCLFSATGHTVQNDSFYYGLSILLAWALWSQRSRRYGLLVWASMMAIAVTAGYLGQKAFGQLSRLAEEYDPQLLSYFMRSFTDPRRSRTSIGDVGKIQLSGKIVVRLQPLNKSPVPVYLREASYRILRNAPGSSYKKRSPELEWDTGITNNMNADPVSETPNGSGIFPLHPGGPGNRSAVTIACYLDGVNAEDKYADGILPLPPDCNRLENSRAYFVYRNNLGTVLAEGPRLMIFDACYGSDMIADAPPNADEYTPNEDLYVPSNEVPAIKQIASSLNVAGQDEDHILLAVGKFFADNFTYSLWQGPDEDLTDTNTALSRFLLETRSGHCEYFATATVLLLRELGIPARYAVGYYVHEPSGDGYIVRERDAHAWCLVWNPKKHSWENFDTTPPDWIAEGEKHASPFEFLSDFQSWLQYEILKFFDYSHDSIRNYIFWALIPALAFLLYRIFRGSRRHKKGRDQTDRSQWPGLDSEFYQLEQKLRRNGLLRAPDEPLSAWLQRATNDPLLAGLKQPLEKILMLHYRYRFDPRGLTQSERQALRREVEVCLSRASPAK